MLSDAQDATDDANFLADDVSGYNVNCIADPGAARAVLAQGQGAAGERPAAPDRPVGHDLARRADRAHAGEAAIDVGDFVQVQRMANPLINELLIGTDQKDYWSRSRAERRREVPAWRSIR